MNDAPKPETPHKPVQSAEAAKPMRKNVMWILVTDDDLIFSYSRHKKIIRTT